MMRWQRELRHDEIAKRGKERLWLCGGLEAVIRCVQWTKGDEEGLTVCGVLVTEDGRPRLKNVFLPKKKFTKGKNNMMEFKEARVKIAKKLYASMRKNPQPMIIDERLKDDFLQYQPWSRTMSGLCGGAEAAYVAANHLQALPLSRHVKELPVAESLSTWGNVYDSVEYSMAMGHIAASRVLYNLPVTNCEPTPQDMAVFCLSLEHHNQLLSAIHEVGRMTFLEFPAFAVPSVLREVAERHGMAPYNLAAHLRNYYHKVFSTCDKEVRQEVSEAISACTMSAALKNIKVLNEVEITKMITENTSLTDTTTQLHIAELLNTLWNTFPDLMKSIVSQNYRSSKADRAWYHTRKSLHTAAYEKKLFRHTSKAQARYRKLHHMLEPSLVQRLMSRTSAETYELRRKLLVQELAKQLDIKIDAWSEKVFAPDIAPATPTSYVEFTKSDWANPEAPPLQHEIIMLPPLAGDVRKRYFMYRDEYGNWHIGKIDFKSAVKVKPKNRAQKEAAYVNELRTFWRPGEYTTADFPWTKCKIAKGGFTGLLPTPTSAEAIAMKQGLRETIRFATVQEPKGFDELLNKTTEVLLRGGATKESLAEYPHRYKMGTWLQEQADDNSNGDKDKPKPNPLKFLRLSNMSHVEVRLSPTEVPCIEDSSTEKALPLYAIILHPKRSDRSQRVVMEASVGHPFFTAVEQLMKTVTYNARDPSYRFPIERFSQDIQDSSISTLRAVKPRTHEDLTACIPQCQLFRQRLQAIFMSRHIPPELPLRRTARKQAAIPAFEVMPKKPVLPSEPLVDEDYDFIPDDQDDDEEELSSTGTSVTNEYQYLTCTVPPSDIPSMAGTVGRSAGATMSRQRKLSLQPARSQPPTSSATLGRRPTFSTKMTAPQKGGSLTRTEGQDLSAALRGMNGGGTMPRWATVRGTSNRSSGTFRGQSMNRGATNPRLVPQVPSLLKSKMSLVELGDYSPAPPAQIAEAWRTQPLRPAADSSPDIFDDDDDEFSPPCSASLRDAEDFPPPPPPLQQDNIYANLDEPVLRNDNRSAPPPPPPPPPASNGTCSDFTDLDELLGQLRDYQDELGGR